MPGANHSLLIRFCFRLLLVGVLHLTTCLLMIRSPHDDDSGLRALLIPPTDCPIPCFMGIQLGVTTLDAAIAALKANSLIQSVTNFSPGQYDLEFVKPFASMRSARMPLLFEAQHGIVERINLYDPGISLSDIVLALGKPAWIILDSTVYQSFVTYAAFYPQYQMYVEADLLVCSLEVSTFWNTGQATSIGIETAQKYARQVSYYPAGAYRTDEGWLQQLRDMKRAHCA